MGVDTKGYLSNDILVSEIFNVIITKYDENATINTEIKEYSEHDKIELGSIYFVDGEDQRRLFVYKDLTGSEKTSLTLGYWNNSVEIMTSILKCFSGELLENDYSELPTIEIPKDENYNHSDRVKMIDKIINVLDVNLSYHEKYKLGNQILKHKEELKELL